MTDPKQIPYLVSLLDDPSFSVRETVTKELMAFGPLLKDELTKERLTLNSVQQKSLEYIWEVYKKGQLKQSWSEWLKLPVVKEDLLADYRRLESALSILSQFLNNFHCDAQLKELLDQLAWEFGEEFKKGDAKCLAKFLFKEKGLMGDEKKYYNSQNSNLVCVIQERKGVPISLTAVLMLVASRLGIRIEGCHFPGHFLARIELDGKKVFMDCLNGGQIVSERKLASVQKGSIGGIKKILYEKTDIDGIVRAFLANLIRSYQMKEDREGAELLIGLFNELDMYLDNKEIAEASPEDIVGDIEPPFP